MKKFKKIKCVVTLRCIWCGNIVPILGCVTKCPYCGHSL